MTPTFSHLDYLLNAVIDDGDYPTSASEARIELASIRAERDALLARVAELAADSIETGKAYSAKCYTVSELQRINGELVSERNALLSELKEYRTLRPVKCNPKCWRNGWDAAQEAAARACEYNSHENMKFYQSIAEVAYNPDDIGVLKYASYSGQSERDATAIRALVPPSPPADCGGQCNPLEPYATWESLGRGIVEIEPDHSEGQ